MLYVTELQVPYCYRVYLDHTQSQPNVAVKKHISKVKIADDKKVDLKKAMDDSNTSLIADILVKVMEDAEQMLLPMSGRCDSMEDEREEGEAERPRSAM